MNNPAKTSSATIWPGLIAVYISWGGTYLAIRFVIETLPPFLSGGFRFVIAGAVLYAFQRLRGAQPPQRTEWRSAAIVGLFMLVGGTGVVMWAEQRVASSIAALIIASVPLWMALIDSLRPGGRRPTGWVISGVIAGFAGILILVNPAQLLSTAVTIDLVGILALLFAAFSWASGSLYNRGAKLPASPLLGVGMEMLVGGFGLLFLGTVLGEWARFDLSAVTLRSWLGFAYLVVVGSWVGYATYMWLLRVAPTMLVSTYAYVNPLVAILIGWLFAGEEMTPRIILAAVFILGSVVSITLKQPNRKKHVRGQKISPTGSDD
ncbi:MAG: EamA family transporter [Anaerolineales bacterium]|jgi:drug/metabolite transporter (DMT)-like permease